MKIRKILSFFFGGGVGNATWSVPKFPSNSFSVNISEVREATTD